MKIRDHFLKWVKRDPLRYHSLHADMVSARSGMTLDQYLWRSAKIAVLTGIVFAVLGFVASAYLSVQALTTRAGIYNVFDIQMPVFFQTVYPSQYMQVIVVLASFIAGTFIGYAVLLRLPALEKNNRKIKINLTLHNAVAYMYAMRRGGAQLMTIFVSLSDRANVYGEVALEFRQIVRDAEFFGYDVVSAIRHLSETTPSEKLKDFLEDLLSVIESGGDMAEFLSMRVRLYQEEARFEQRQFLNVLSIVAESYVTLFVAGPLFLIIIMVVMGMMGGSAVIQLALVTYLVLPIGSLVFILLIDLISIKTEKTERYVRTKWLHTFSDVTIVKKTGEDTLFEQLKKYDQLRNLVYHLKHPLESFISNANHTLYVTVPVALIYIIIVFLRAPHYADIETYITVVDDHIVIALLMILIPYAVFYEIWSRKVLGIQALIPDFLERMAGINQVGLTIAQAIAIMVNTNLGLLSYEIRRIKRDMEWGANFTEALMRFEERVSTPSIARTVTLITKASEMSGQIGEVLSIASSDAKMTEILKKERLSEMFIYTAIVYLSFFVFLFVVGVLTTQFLPVLANISTQGLPATGALSGIGSIPIMTFSRLLYHACLVQAIFSGLIAGQMGESSLAAGVKHSCILLIIALIAFNFVLVV
ncbi:MULTISPECIES: type II secretion system F family protein [unclassified Methanoregula]|uniref:type II secretion system F family protein n=1 Tax=unclassified Methanoregula TaxID=2649730 RepID=UPI0009CFAB9E|nr:MULTISPECIES: type II secretion system F family protein [unclassified Methanoregula]OPX64205.1 MAG: flagellar assembly protein J [Methanoregula sp. PtaB.Bin085]OPY33671.1 MAG: flagellar assembly protein J [Methanoregula sp. PtaU1.Bin006]